ncbi:MAG TPA: RNA 2',3'-cyclic phosphodiesterase [Gaiellaceae bacterium]|nr:RNA 2',3'-cyclic phosphodiesterase [Gaiellaceae bacterium]
MTPTGSVGSDESLRLFLALRLPDSVLDVLCRWGDQQLGAGRRVPRESLHVTLAFLGARPAAELPAIVEALRHAAAGTDPFPLAAIRYRETQSVGMVVLDDSTGEATRLAEQLHDRLEALGVYRREARPWLPHVTVLRFRERPGLRPPVPQLGTFVPSDAAAYLSRLGRTGARYEVLASVHLGESTPHDDDAARRMNG